MDQHADDVASSSERAAFALLQAGVPLSLLLDLAMPVHSTELLYDERADTSWVPRAAVGLTMSA